eukprot:3176136-Prymnesium_polylepis.2
MQCGLEGRRDRTTVARGGKGRGTAIACSRYRRGHDGRSPRGSACGLCGRGVGLPGGLSAGCRLVTVSPRVACPPLLQRGGSHRFLHRPRIRVSAVRKAVRSKVGLSHSSYGLGVV